MQPALAGQGRPLRTIPGLGVYNLAQPERSAVLELLRAIEERAVVYFCLPALQFPVMAQRAARSALFAHTRLAGAYVA